jgi:hypothetical protein
MGSLRKCSGDVQLEGGKNNAAAICVSSCYYITSYA